MQHGVIADKFFSALKRPRGKLLSLRAYVVCLFLEIVDSVVFLFTNDTPHDPAQMKRSCGTMLGVVCVHLACATEGGLTKASHLLEEIATVSGRGQTLKGDGGLF